MASSKNDDSGIGYRIDGSCWQFEPVYSDGIWDDRENIIDIFKHSLLLLNVQLAIIFLITTALHFFFKRLRLPRFISEVLAGIILGPTLFGRYFPTASQTLFPPGSINILVTLMRFGYLFFMFLIGVKMDIRLVTKAGKQAWIMASSVILFPLLGITLSVKEVCKAFDHYNKEQMEWVILLTGTLMLTSFPVVACLLMHLKIMNTELGYLALSSALISDLLSIIAVNGDNYARLVVEVSPRVGYKSMILSVTLIVFIVMGLRRIMYWIIARTPEGKQVRNSWVFSIVITLMVVCIFGDQVGLQYLYGPFIFGLMVPSGPPLASILVEKLDTIVTGLLLPLLSTFCGFKSNLWVLQKVPPAFMIYVITVGFPVKFLSCFLAAFFCKLPVKDSMIIALLLNAKGIVELGVFATNADKQPIAADQFTATVLIVFVVAAIVPLIIVNVYDTSNMFRGYKLRDVVHSSDAEGLRLLICAHRQDDASTAINLLENMSPSKQNLLDIYALYLEELVGGSTPFILDHQLGQKISSFGGSRWQPIVDAFSEFKLKHSKSVQVSIFTAISPQKLMHDNVSWVAFDNTVSMVLLPFHKKWNSKGNVILNSGPLRTLNRNVFDRAPCSVGILVDRSKISGGRNIQDSPFYRIAVLYMGGKDDLEVLAVGKRLSKSSNVRLTIINVKSTDDFHSQEKHWQVMMNDEYMKELQRSSEHCNVSNKEEVVRDGADMVNLTSSIVAEYDLILVGRRHEADSPFTLGLSEFCELPELGMVGDMLASSDIRYPVSVMVVQQQIIKET